MRARFHCIMRLPFAFLLASALLPSCLAQEVAFLDLTKGIARDDLRRPKAAFPVRGGRSGIHSTTPCLDRTKEVGALQTTLVSLDRTNYRVGDRPTFEVKIENVGSTAVQIPFSPHMADLQPRNPAQKFSYYKLAVSLWVTSGDVWGTGGGGLQLYGNKNHANTMLTLKPGESVRIIGKGELTLDEELVKLSRSGHAADHIEARSSLYREHLLITPNQSAGVGREVCLAKAQQQTIPIELAVP